MFERFTDRSRRVLVYAQEEASRFNHPFIGTEHLLLGLIREGEGVAATVLAELDVTLEAAREQIEQIVGRLDEAPQGSPPFTPRAKKVLELAMRESLDLGVRSYIGTEHLLLGLVREGNGAACVALANLGVSGEDVRERVIEYLGQFKGPQETPNIIAFGPEPSVGRRGLMARASGRVVEVSCSFCDRRPPETGRLVGRGRVAICEHCIQEWAGRLRPESTEPPDGGTEGG